MISKKLNQSLKIGIFILIAISSFLIFPEISQACSAHHGDAASLNCGCQEATCNFNILCCGTWVAGGMLDNNKACMINSLGICNGSGKDIFGSCVACAKSMYQWGDTNKCPNVAQNATCDVKGGWNCDWGTSGSWDGSDSVGGKCIKCLGQVEDRIYADLAQIYTSGNGDTGSIAGDGRCESACGASPECDEAANIVGVAVPGGTCNSCTFAAGPVNCPDGACDVAGGECATCPADCTVADCCGNGVCDAAVGENSSNCPGDCGDCEDTCTCTCPAECPCGSGTCPPELRGGLVPCGKSCDDPCTKSCECCPCTLCHLFVLFKRIVDFLTINIIFPLAILMFVVGGIMFLTAAGDPGRIGGAKKILTATLIGLVIILTAWLIVDTIITFITPAGSPFQAWNTINCPVP